MSTRSMLRACAAAVVAGSSLLVLSSALLPSGAVSAAVTRQTTAARPAGLHVSGPAVKLPSSADFSTFTEAPNGDAYYASESSVYVIKGTSAPALVLAAKGTVMALAASSTGLFVDVGKTVTEYNSSKAAVRTWRLPGRHRVTSAGLFAVGSKLWAWTDWATDASGLEYGNAYRFAASSASVQVVGSGNVLPGFAVASSTGFYYEAPDTKVADGGYLVGVTPSGSVHRVRDSILVTSLALAGGRVEALSQVVHRSTIKTYLDSYAATTLKLAFARSVPKTDAGLAGTGLGLLLLSATQSVSEVSTKTGAAGSTLAVPGALSLLSGPSAAVITEVSGSFYLERLVR